MTPAQDDSPFCNLADLVRQHAVARPQQPALVQGEQCLSYAALDRLMDRVAAALQRDGVLPGQAIALCGASTPQQAALFLGALRAGVVVAPLAPGSTAASLVSMLQDAAARWLFVDASAADWVPEEARVRCIALEPGAPGFCGDAHG